MKEFQRDIQIMENFEHIYTQKLDDTTAGSDLSVSQIKALFAFNDGTLPFDERTCGKSWRQNFPHEHDS